MSWNMSPLSIATAVLRLLSLLSQKKYASIAPCDCAAIFSSSSVRKTESMVLPFPGPPDNHRSCDLEASHDTYVLLVLIHWQVPWTLCPFLVMMLARSSIGLVRNNAARHLTCHCSSVNSELAGRLLAWILHFITSVNTFSRNNTFNSNAISLLGPL